MFKFIVFFEFIQLIYVVNREYCDMVKSMQDFELSFDVIVLSFQMGYLFLQSCCYLKNQSFGFGIFISLMCVRWDQYFLEGEEKFFYWL